MTYVGIELLETADVTSQGRSVRAALADYGFHRRWRVMWRSGITYFLAAAAALFAHQTYTGTDQRIADGYADLVKDDGFVDAALLWFDVQNLVPGTMSTTVALWFSAAAYIIGGFALIALGQYFWNRWDRVEVNAEMGPGVVDRDRVYIEQQGLIVFHALVAFVAIWPRLALRGWRRLDFQSWDSLGVLVVLLGGLFIVGWAFPKLLGAMKVQERVRRRSGGRLDKTLAIAQYELNKGNFAAAASSFERAHELGKELHSLGNLRVPTAVITSGWAQARDRLTNRARESGSASKDLLSDEYIDQTLRLYQEAATDPTPSPAIYLRLAYYEFVHNGDAVAVAHYIDKATELAPRDYDVLLARVIKRSADGDGPGAAAELAAIRTTRLESSMRALAAPAMLAAEAAIYAMSGPDPVAATRLGSITELLDSGVRAPLADLRPVLANMPDTWTTADRQRIRSLVNQVNGLSVEPVVDLRDDEIDPAIAVAEEVS